MADLAFLSLIVAFFALALLLVRACERIIGAGEESAALPSRTPAAKRELVAVTGPGGRSNDTGPGSRSAQ